MVPLNVNSQANKAGYNKFCYDVGLADASIVRHIVQREFPRVTCQPVKARGFTLRFVCTLNKGREIPCALALVEYNPMVHI